MTLRLEILDRCAVMSSVMPSLKYAFAVSPPMLSKGSTTMDRRANAEELVVSAVAVCAPAAGRNIDARDCSFWLNANAEAQDRDDRECGGESTDWNSRARPDCRLELDRIRRPQRFGRCVPPDLECPRQHHSGRKAQQCEY